MLTDYDRMSARGQLSNECVDHPGVVGLAWEALIDEFRYEVCAMYIQRCETMRWRWGTTARMDRLAKPAAWLIY